MRIKLIATFCFLFGATSAFAADSKTEFVVPQYQVYLSSGFIGISKGSTQLDLSPGFQYRFLAPWLQVGGEVTYQKISFRDGSTSNMIFLGGPSANYEGFVFSIGVALKQGSTSAQTTTPASSDTTNDNPNGFGFYFLVAKHFPLSPSFSLRPSVGVISTGSTQLVIRPFAVSYSF